MELLKVFNLSPSFFSFVAGVFVSVGTNLFTSILLDDKSHSPFLYGAILLVGIAVVCFLIVTLSLEELKDKARGGDLGPHIRTSRQRLSIALAIGCLTVVASFVMMYLAGRA